MHKWNCLIITQKMLLLIITIEIPNEKVLQMPVYCSSAKQLPGSITIWCFTALKSCSALLIGSDSFTNFLIYSNVTSDLLTDLFFKGFVFLFVFESDTLDQE